MNKDFIVENGCLTAYLGDEEIVEVPDGVREIGDDVFSGSHRWCKLETSTGAEERVWHRRTGPKRVVLPPSVRIIRERAFENNTCLRYIALPSGLEEIQDSAFAGCVNLDTINVPRGVEMAASAFARCYGLADEQGFIIVNGALFGCRSKEGHIDIPKGVSEIMPFALQNNSFSSVRIPESVYAVWRGAFEQCKNLRKVIFEGQPAVFGEIFDFCLQLESIEAEEELFEELWCRLYEGQQMNLIVHALRNNSFNGTTGKVIVCETERVVRYLAEKEDAELLKVCLERKNRVRPDELEDYLDIVRDSAELTTVLLEYRSAHYTAAELEQHASDSFAKDLGLMERTLEDWQRIFKITRTIKGITIEGYRKSSGGVEVIPPQMGGFPVIAIGMSAFERNCQLREVEIPASVHSIGGAAFIFCVELRRVHMEDGVDFIHRDAFRGCRSLEELRLSEKIHTIGNGAFSGCSALTELTLPGKLTHMSEKAFSGCTALRQVTIPGSVRRIGDDAFMNCASLGSVVVENGVGAIDAGAFTNCTALKEIRIPKSTGYISPLAFRECKKLCILASPDSYACEYARIMNIPFKAI